eukprot:TRINITY_DN8433_c0_g1_i2.p1 TRINITY_DN8433_c0_g1~~TRINITY_DN8433_c0_g1_i2.p1  ORF type:complete len:174 (+),score=24.43 TRINITY_DN8433_c0_g1_i2:77-523(+)
MAAEAAARSRALLHGPSLLCCSLCERQTAAVDCATCKASMCQPCAASLHKTGVHARHKLFPLGQGGPEPRECPRHAGEVLNLYCRGTGEVVCGACATARGITDCSRLRSWRRGRTGPWTGVCPPATRSALRATGCSSTCGGASRRCAP